MSSILLLDVVIRKMEMSDLDAVYTLDQGSFTTPWPKNSFRFELNENKAARLWVAEAQNDDGNRLVIGALVCWLLIDQAHIATLAIDTAYRRMQIATTLLCTALNEMSKEGAVEAQLEVRASNEAALRMYTKFGFQKVGRRKAYYKDTGEDAILMTLFNLSSEHLHNIPC